MGEDFLVFISGHHPFGSATVDEGVAVVAERDRLDINHQSDKILDQVTFVGLHPFMTLGF